MNNTRKTVSKKLPRRLLAAVIVLVLALGLTLGSGFGALAEGQASSDASGLAPSAVTSSQVDNEAGQPAESTALTDESGEVDSTPQSEATPSSEVSSEPESETDADTSEPDADTSEPDADTSEPEADTSEPESQPAPPASKPESEATAQEPGMGRRAAARQSATVRPLAVLDGQDMTEADNNVDIGAYNAMYSPMSLTVNASFDVERQVAKTLTIELAEGLAFESLPGMVPNADKNGWSFSLDELSDKNSALVGFITGGVYTPAEKHKYDDGEGGFISAQYQPRAGSVTYTLSPGAGEVPGFGIGVALDKPYAAFDGSVTLTDAIQVSTSEDGSEKDAVKLETYVVRNVLSHGRFVNSTLLFLKPGDSYDMNTSKVCCFYSIDEILFSSDTISRRMTKGWMVVLKSPRFLGMSTELNLSASSWTADDVTLTDVSDIYATNEADKEEYIYLQLEVDTRGAVMTSEGVQLTGQVSAVEDIPDKYKHYIGSADGIQLFTVVTSKVEFYNGIEKSDVLSVNGDRLIRLVDPLATSNLTFLPFPNAVISGHDVSNPATLTALGGFAYENASAEEITNQRLRITYDTSKIAVDAFFIRGMSSGAASDIIVRTTKGDKIFIDGPRNMGALLKLSDIKPTAAADEHILEVEYTAARIAAGARDTNGVYGFQNPASGGTWYLGKLLADSGSYNGVITKLKENPDETARETTPYVVDGEPYTQTMQILTSDADMVEYTGLVSASVSASTGSRASLSMTVLTNLHRYYLERSYAHKGFTYYIRQAEGLEVLRDTIKVVWGDQTWTADTLDIKEITDKDGTPVFAISCPQVIMGAFSERGVRYAGAVVSVDVNVRPTARPGSFPMSEIFMANQSDNVPAAAVGAYAKDVYELVEGVDHSTYNLGTPGPIYTFTITANDAFVVQTAADRSDGAWTTYNAADNSGIINLNAKLPARYQVTVANALGRDVEGGYSVIVPIPKEGQSTPTKASTGNDNTIELQSAPFGWSLYLNEDVTDSLNQQVSGANFEVRYATSYLTDTTDPGWKAWADIANKDDIKAILVTCKDRTLSNGLIESFNIPLTMPDDAEASRLVNATNTYSALVITDFPGVQSGSFASLPVSLCLKTGIAKGSVMITDPLSGNNGMQVIAYKAGSRLETDIEDRTIVAADGSFQLSGLNSEQAVDLVFVNAKVAGESVLRDSLRFVSGVPSLTVASGHASASINGLTPSTPAAEDIQVSMELPFEVSFVSSGTATPSIYQFNGETIAAPAAPYREGHSFDGWYVDDQYTTSWVFATSTVTADTPLYGKLTPVPVSVTFYQNYSSTDSTLYAAGNTANTGKVFGDSLTEPTDPVRSGYSFDGWYTDREGTSAWDFSTGSITTTADLNLYAKWTQQSYALSYDLHDSTTYPADDAAGYTQDSVLYAALLSTAEHYATPSRPGYSFDGWYLGYSDGIYSDPVNAETTMPAAASTLHAKWSLPVSDYTISYTLGTESSNGEGNPTAYNAESSFPLTLVAPSKTGNSFLGWTATAEGYGSITLTDGDKIPAGVYGNITLTAVWDVNSYALSYDLHDSTTYPADDAAGYTQDSVLYAARISTAEHYATPSRPGYSFDGWYLGYSGGTYSDPVNAETTMPAAASTLHAKWSLPVSDYTISYTLGTESSNGEGNPTAYNAESSFPLTLAAPSKTGNSFLGWTATAEGYGSITLTAVWDVNSYALSYDLHDSTTYPADDAAGYTQDSVLYAARLSTAEHYATPSRPGYSFDGWYLGYSDGTYSDPVNAETTMPAAASTLHAKWTAKTYEIEYDYDQGAAGASMPSSYTVDALPLTLTSPVRTGHSFAGWVAQVNRSGDDETYETFALQISTGEVADTIPADQQSIYGKIQLRASWVVNPYQLSFELGGNEKYPTAPATIPDVDVDYGNPISGAPGYMEPSRVGWEFDGWYLDEQLSMAVGEATMPAAATSIYAKWKQLSYTATFYTETGAEASTQTVHYKDLLTKPQDPEREGYDFLGWYTQETGGARWNFNTDTMPASLLALFPRYEAIPFKVTFAYGGAPIEEMQVSVTYNEKLDEPQPPTWSGYAFKGWADENGALWNFATGTMPARAITLTAQWKQTSFAVSYYWFNGELMHTETVEAGAKVPFQQPPVIDGWAFARWVLKDNTDTGWDFDSSMPEHDLELLAYYNRLSVPQETPDPTEPVSSSTTSRPASSVASTSAASSSVVEESSSVVSSQESAIDSSTTTAGTTEPSQTSEPQALIPLSEAQGISRLISNIQNGQPPLAGVFPEDELSMVSLLLAVLNLILAAYMLISTIVRRRVSKVAGVILRLLSALMGAAGVALFLATNDFGAAAVVAVNFSTVILTLLLAVQAVVGVVGIRRDRLAYLAEDSDV